MPDTEITRAQTRERARLLFVRSYDVELDFTHGPRHLRVRIYAKLAQAYARTAYACFDQPDLKAVFTFQVTAPAHWTVLSNQPQAPAERTRGDSLVLASENAGCVLISEQLLVRSPAASPTLIESRTATVLHEMAHMWFGDSATGQGPLGRGPPQCRRVPGRDSGRRAQGGGLAAPDERNGRAGDRHRGRRGIHVAGAAGPARPVRRALPGRAAGPVAGARRPPAGTVGDRAVPLSGGHPGVPRADRRIPGRRRNRPGPGPDRPGPPRHRRTGASRTHAAVDYRA